MQQTMQQTEQQWLFLAGFAVYLLAMIALGWWVSRRQPGDAQQSGEDFLLGGRALPFWLMLGTTVATMVGTGSSMGAVGYASAAASAFCCWPGGLPRCGALIF